ncbi:MAG: hypothetical protein CMC74_03875 [Flavobacteriaceae bacterium]|nr:hypothetical protein [Flavobacteriaceae bacterium]|tara:strand:- start:82993 stop:83598 length:606 start_codon:yes stop_codon:yes gene_type:complete
MKYFLKIGAYIWHPLLMPLLGTLIYFIITPRYFDIEIIKAKVIAIAILSLFIPIVTYFLLKNLRMVNSIKLEQVWERKIPLMLQSLLILAITKLVFDPYISPELYFFFVGILFSTLSALLMVFFKIKISLHQMGIAGLTLFVIALSVHFQVNMLLWIALFLFANGWVASSRLYTKSHTQLELILGFFFGVIPQLLVLNSWL